MHLQPGSRWPASCKAFVNFGCASFLLTSSSVEVAAAARAAADSEAAKARAAADAEAAEALKVAEAKAAAAAEELLADEEEEKQQASSTKAGKAKQSKGKR